MFNISYPIICNNESGDSILYVLLTLANAIIYGRLHQVYINFSNKKDAISINE